MQAEWYYVGHYGQLGPLTIDQMEELIEGSVVSRETLVWKPSMENWLPASQVPEVINMILAFAPLSPPPVPEMPRTPPPLVPPYGPITTNVPYGAISGQPAYNPYELAVPVSDKSRVVAGVLNLLIPGAGRIYLGYSAIGVLQLFLTICSGGVLYL